jgi:ATP-dependent Zn protease
MLSNYIITRSLTLVVGLWFLMCFSTLEFVEAGHALVGALMPEYDPVAKISIIPRGQAGGLTFFAPSEERLESGLYSRSYLENQMAVALGGRCSF